MTDWPELRDRFREVVGMHRRAGRTVDEIASDIPCHRATIYRLIDGTFEKPNNLSLRNGIEKFVRRASQTRQAESTPTED